MATPLRIKVGDRARQGRVACPSTSKFQRNFGKWQTSTFGQSSLANAINIMLEVLGVLVDASTFRAFNCEIGIDPQHLRGCGSRLLKLSRLGIGARQRDMRPILTGLARYAFAAPMHRVSIALPHVIGQTHLTKRRGQRKRIEADDRLEYLDRSCGV